jgi:hypothetical protein
VDDFTVTTAVNILQVVCHFIDSHASVVENYGANLFNVSFSHRCKRALYSFFVSDTSLAAFEHASPLVHASLRQNTVKFLR